MSEESKLPTNEAEAQEYIDKLVEEAYGKISEAEEIAQKFDIHFSFDLAYGMGGSYDPEEGEWMSSSSQC